MQTVSLAQADSWTGLKWESPLLCLDVSLEGYLERPACFRCFTSDQNERNPFDIPDDDPNCESEVRIDKKPKIKQMKCDILLVS